MRYSRITLRGITRYEDEVSLDLDAIGPGLIALAGPNGAGKTTILEAPVAGLQLEYPSRPGPLHQVAHGKDAMIGLGLADGTRTSVHIDAVLKQPKTEAYLFDGDVPVVSGKVREYQAEIERRYGSRRLMLSAMLSAQGGLGRFLDLGKAERKELLSEILDTAGLQEIAEAARGRARSGDTQAERLRGQLESAQSSLSQLAEEPDDLEDLLEQREQLEAKSAQLAANLEEAREAYSNLQRQQAEAESMRKEVERLAGELDRVKRQLDTNAQEQSRVSRDNDHRQATLEHEIQLAQQEADRLSEYENAERQLTALREELAGQRTALEAVEAELERRQATLREADAQNVRIDQQRTRIQATLDAAQRSVEVMDDVPCAEYTEPIDLPGTCPLLADARTNRQRMQEAQQELAELAPLVDTERLHTACDEARANQVLAQTSIRDLELRISDLEELALLAPTARAADQTIQRARRDLADALAERDRRSTELQRQADELVARRDELTADLEAANATIPEDLGPQLEEAAQRGRSIRKEHEETAGKLRGLDRMIARAEANAERRRELETTVDDLTEQITTLEADTAEWRTIEQAFGRDGIQALEIDAAGPELSELTTDLLRTCFGPRFEVQFVTQAPRKSGGMKEVFDVTVLDYERGREGDVGTLSGGEKTIISEAISLALAIYVGRTSEHRFETLFRDETAGALDPDNAARYVQMLRRALLISSAYQIVYIAQQREVWEAADAVVWVDDGRLEVLP
jgi:exonuclease SbcC